MAVDCLECGKKLAGRSISDYFCDFQCKMNYERRKTEEENYERQKRGDYRDAKDLEQGIIHAGS